MTLWTDALTARIRERIDPMKRPIPAPYDQIDGAFGMLGAVRDAIPIGLVLFLLFVIAGLLS